MAPVDALAGKVDNLIKDNAVMVFSKSTCPFCRKVKNFFTDQNVKFTAIELDQMGNEGRDIQDYLLKKTGQKTVPNVFVEGNHLGGCDDTLKAAQSPGFMNSLKGKASILASVTSNDTDGTSLVARGEFEYDLIVVGGGSGGLAASKEAAKYGLKTAVFDYVKPTPIGTTWGLGGTCVNVGCIPKKLMHQAALLGESLDDAQNFGWEIRKDSDDTGDYGDKKPTHNWEQMVVNVQNYIKGLNWNNKTQLRSQSVKYFNELVRFTGPNTIVATKKNGDTREVTASIFVLAVGGRPRYPDIPGAKELGITSDDIFSLPYNPGKTLLVGASYISLETAGFLSGIGLDVTVMVRSILLRGFDQQLSEKIGSYMVDHGIKFVRPCVPTKLEKVEDGEPGKVKVYAQYNDGTEFTDVFNTVIFAVGRDADTSKLGLDQLGVNLNPKNGKVIVDDGERSNVPHVFAIGDMIDGKPELTPVAIQAGRLLARRIAGVSSVKTDYDAIPTTVFTPIEYGTCGLSEEAAEEKYGKEDLDVFHTNFWPLEWTISKRPENASYAKVICVKSQKNRVVGFHYLGPNAGEVTQGYAGMIKLGATKDDFDNLIGIHPTTAEVFTTMSINKASGEDPTAAGC